MLGWSGFHATVSFVDITGWPGLAFPPLLFPSCSSAPSTDTGVTVSRPFGTGVGPTAIATVRRASPAFWPGGSGTRHRHSRTGIRARSGLHRRRHNNRFHRLSHSLLIIMAIRSAGLYISPVRHIATGTAYTVHRHSPLPFKLPCSSPIQYRIRSIHRHIVANNRSSHHINSP